MVKMKIEKVVVGSLEENCYILDKDNMCIIIDPGSEFLKIKDKIGNRKVLACLITHNHFDHVGALKEVVDAYKTPIYDFNNLIEGKHNIGSFSLLVISNPGHTEDSISYYFYNEKVMFVGRPLKKFTKIAVNQYSSLLI